MFACIIIGKGGDAQSSGMGSHVPAIGQQGHGAKNVSGRNFYNHHRKGQQDNPFGIAFSLVVFDVKPVAVFPAVQVVNVHNVIKSPLRIRSGFKYHYKYLAAKFGMQITMLEAIMGTHVQLSNRLSQRMNPIYIASILIKPITPGVNCFAN
jgi:hypothetical protein